MPNLETQVGQIYINNKKLSKSFVSLFSEKIAESNAEIYVLVEFSALESGKWIEYEKVVKQIASNIKKHFYKVNPNSFENAIASVNDYLAQLASQGKTDWVGKTNACLAVRQDENLYISTAGKIHAYLFRDKQFSDIADTKGKNSPLKVFENFVIGKIKRKDFLIFTTTQLFNYISIERLKDILNNKSISEACENIAALITESADQSVSFGTFILEINIARAEAEPEMKNTKIFAELSTPSWLQKIKNRKIGLPKISLHKINVDQIKTQIQPENIKARAKAMVDIQKFHALPKTKRFFLITAAIFFVLLLVNITVVIRAHNANVASSEIQAKANDVQNKINDANADYIYKDHTDASNLIGTAQNELNQIPDNAQLSISKNKLQQEIDDLASSIKNSQNSKIQNAKKQH